MAFVDSNELQNNREEEELENFRGSPVNIRYVLLQNKRLLRVQTALWTEPESSEQT